MKIETNILVGLTEFEAEKRLSEYGKNQLDSVSKKRPLAIFLGQFKDMMVMILLVATVLSAFMGEVVEAFAIITIVILNALIGFFQEYRTEKTLDALKQMASPSAKVIRDGKIVLVDATEVVPGDVLSLEAGDRVPADAYIYEQTMLSCDESMLTGESILSDKQAATGGKSSYKPEEMVYMGTMVAKGKGMAVVLKTGMNTEMGSIADMLGNIEESETPLQKNLDQVGQYIAIGCLVICTIVAFVGIVRGENPFDMLIVGISLAVAAVPEGLPAIVTISLAIAVKRILHRGALIKRLHAIETLGCATVICSDKTGTLTENKMTVKKAFTFDETLNIEEFGRTGQSKGTDMLAEIAAVCINVDEHSAIEGVGDPTEIAIFNMASQMRAKASRWSRVREIPFDSTTKRMTVVAANGNVIRSFVKGAPEVLLPLCKHVMVNGAKKEISQYYKQRVNDTAAEMAGDALRVIGFAYADLSGANQNPEQNLIFVGLAGMVDPPRKEAFAAVKSCKNAGIRPVMITGDHAATAKAIASELGICAPGDEVLTGAMLDDMSDEALSSRCRSVSVYARVSPAHKLRIVRAIKKHNEVVAMTGDGVNDAPAIKEADIGVSMGITGTDVTKEASDMVLLDDNFATIVASVEEGRIVYKNIRRSIRYLLSCNIGEIITMFGGMILGAPVILTPIQLLLVNLVTDGLPAIALSVEPGHSDIMFEKPRRREDSIFAGGLWGKMSFRGFIIGIITLLSFSVLMRYTGDLGIARCGALMTLIFSQLFHVMECRSEKQTIFEINPFGNNALLLATLISGAISLLCMYVPYLRSIVGIGLLNGSQMLFSVILAALAPIVTALVTCVERLFKKENEDDYTSVQPIRKYQR